VPAGDPEDRRRRRLSPYLGLDHIGLGSAASTLRVAELKAKGAEFTMEPTTARPGVRIAFLRGPEQVTIEAGRSACSLSDERHRDPRPVAADAIAAVQQSFARQGYICKTPRLPPRSSSPSACRSRC